jgi:hypothetical protein
MSLYRPKRSPYWHYDFWLKGHRFLGSAETANRRKAEALEALRKEQARVEVAALAQAEAQLKGRAPLTLDVAAGQWWIEVGQHRADSKTCWADTASMLAHFGAGKRLDQITDAEIAQWVARRRGDRVWGKVNLKSGAAAPLLSPAKAIFHFLRARP